MSLESVLIIAAILFAIGLYGSLARRNALVVLMSIELMFNAVNLTFVGLSRYIVPAGIQQDLGTLLTGQVFAVFIITVAAAEIALGLGCDGAHVHLGGRYGSSDCKTSGGHRRPPPSTICTASYYRKRHRLHASRAGCCRLCAS